MPRLPASNKRDDYGNTSDENDVARFMGGVREKTGALWDKVSPSVHNAVGMLGSKELQNSLRQQFLSYVVPPSGAALAFGASLLGAQATGAALRISCATPVVSSALGFATLCLASVTAAQAAHNLRRAFSQEPPGENKDYLSKEALLVNAFVGVVAFKVLGGKFHNLMPSSLVHPGALSTVSIPARGSKYANGFELKVIQDIFKRYGCHHCGKKAGACIADHMPPNLIVHGRGWAKAVATGVSDSFMARIRASLPFFHFGRKMVEQRLYPQCVDCMKLQSTALRHGRSATVVFHFRRGVPELPYFTGVFIGAMRLEGSSQGGEKVYRLGLRMGSRSTTTVILRPSHSCCTSLT